MTSLREYEQKKMLKNNSDANQFGMSNRYYSSSLRLIPRKMIVQFEMMFSDRCEGQKKF